MLLKPVKEEPEELPPIPTVNITIEADKATLMVSLGNGFFIQQVLTAQTMEDICRTWRESRKQLARQQQLVADVMRTKK